MHWEVELKFAVADIPATTAKITALGAHFSEPVHQADHYFNHPARDFGQTDEALRLRQVGEHNFITYKGPKVDSTSKTRRELELPLPSGPDTPVRFSELLAALGFQFVATVRKTRRKAEFDWNNHHVEFSLDAVESIGTFFELEITADEATLDSARLALKSLSDQLNLGPSERRSYLELQMGKSS